MSQQHDDGSTPLCTANFTSLRDQALAGKLQGEEALQLATKCPSSRVSEALLVYGLTGNCSLMDLSDADVFLATVYSSHVVQGEPAMNAGQLVSLPGLTGESRLPVIRSRSLLFNEVLVLHWLDEPVDQVELADGRLERVLHAPLELEWNGNTYHLLGESLNKSFYWPDHIPVPGEIQPWLTVFPQDRTDLVTGLKRQGFPLAGFAGLPVSPEQIHDVDWGVWVLCREQMQHLTGELGLPVDASQVTVWFDDGSYFKGTIIGEPLSGLSAGMYGGLKRPRRYSSDGLTARCGSIMDNYVFVPWHPSMNRQQADYAGVPLPVRAQLPSQEVFAKASTGFPAYVDQYNNQLLSAAANVFRRISVRGVAGKVAVGILDAPVQFIVRGPKVEDVIKPMAFLFNPTLPVHTQVMKVQVAFIHDETLPGNLIQVNVADCNREWVDNWYIKYAGRDMDGDGFTLSDDPLVLELAVPFDEMTWFDTAQFKSVDDAPCEDDVEAIRTATERIRKYSGRIGIYDKLARRILRHDARLITWDVRVLLTEAIQRSISAQKKNSGADKFEGYAWLLQHLPDEAPDWLFHNVHDEIDDVSDAARHLLHTIQAGGGDTNALVTAKDRFLTCLHTCKDAMPEHYTAAIDLLSMVMTVHPEQVHAVRERGRRLWAKYQARNEDVEAVMNFIVKAKALWRRVKSPDNEDYMTYAAAAQVVKVWASELAQTASPHLVLGAMLSELSISLLGKILTVDNLRLAGVLDGLYVPVTTGTPLQPGMQGDGNAYISMLAHPAYIRYLNDDRQYIIDSVYTNSAANWIVPRSSLTSQSNYILKLKEVK